jgi:demethylmenaquinone methyltransferase/2-methoxy-6-polyprenyl-1,4-benzoquinol methylase
MPDPALVRPMFGRIARHYDLLNRLLTLGIDRRWRAAVVRAAGPLAGRRVLDSCCGTGDLALALAGAGAQVVAVDFTPQMLSRAARKRGARAVQFVHGDALQLPLADASVQVAAVAFGLRNLADRRAGLAELVRVVRPGGRVLVLELSLPEGPLLGRLYRSYFTSLLPRIGRWVSGDGAAYRYLPDTVLSWPGPEELRGEFEAQGLLHCQFRRLSGGICALHQGDVP